MTTGINDPTLSLLLAVEGAERYQGRDANTALYRALAGHREMKKLFGHDAYLEGAAFDPSGTRLLTWDNDGRAILWDPAAGTILRSLDEHERCIKAAAFSPDGTRVVTASEDGTARTWDVATGRTVAVLGGHGGPVLAAAFLPSGDRVATSSADGTARIFDAADGRERLRFSLHAAPVTSVDPSPDGTLLLTCGKDGFARVWRASDGVETLQLPLREGAGAPETPDPTLPDNIAGPDDRAFFMLGGTRILACRSLREVRLFDARGGEMLERIGGDGLLHNLVAVSPERGHAVLCSRARKDQPGTTVEFRDLSGARPPVSMVPKWWPTWGALGPGGRRFLALPIGYDAFVLDRDMGIVESELRGHAYWVRGGGFDPSGTRAVTASADMSARIWRVTTPDDVRLAFTDGTAVSTGALDVAPDGRSAIRCLPPDASGRRAVVRAAVGSGEVLEVVASEPGAPDYAAFAAGGRRVALSWGTKLRVVELGGRRTVAEMETPPHGPLIPDREGNRIYLCGDRGIGTVADVAAGRVLPFVFGDPDRHVLAVDWAPGGRRLVTADGGGATATIWDVDTGKVVRKIAGHAAWVIDAEFSPDGRRVATTAMDQTAQVWDAETGAWVVTVSGLPKVESRLGFHPSGDRLVVFSRWQARIADAATGEILGMVEAPPGDDDSRVYARAWFAPDGESLLACTHSWRLFRHPLDPLAYAKARLPRALDPQERNRYAVGSEEARAAFQREWTLTQGRTTDLLAYGFARLRLDDVAGAFEAFEAAEKVRPRSPNGFFGSACGHGRKSRMFKDGSPDRASEIAKALDALEEAAALGWDRWEQLKQSPYLEPLREEPRYRALVEGK